MPLAAWDTAPRPERVRAAYDSSKAGGGDDGRRAYDAVVRARQGASPGGVEGSGRRRSQGRGGRRRQEGLRRPEAVRAANEVGYKDGGSGVGRKASDGRTRYGPSDDGKRACDAVARARHCASPGRGEGLRRRRPQGRRRRQWQEGLLTTLSAARDTAPLLKWVREANNDGFKGGSGDALPVGARAADDVDFKGRDGEAGCRACDAVGRAHHGAFPRAGKGRMLSASRAAAAMTNTW